LRSSVPQKVKISRIFKTKSSSACSLKTATGPYPKLNRSNAYPPTQFVEDIFQYYLPINASPILPIKTEALNKFNVRFINLSKIDCLTVKLLLALASTVILGSESHETHDHILLSDGSGGLQAILSI
jgi:hypothetical protein